MILTVILLLILIVHFDDHLVTIEAEVLNTLIEKKNAVGIFFDVDKAYYTVNRKLIYENLETWKFRGPLLMFIKSYLSKRYIRVRVVLACKETGNGIPQGSVLSCTLFV